MVPSKRGPSFPKRGSSLTPRGSQATIINGQELSSSSSTPVGEADNVRESDMLNKPRDSVLQQAIPARSIWMIERDKADSILI